MCKIGILAIGFDLYDSAFQRCRTLLPLLRQRHANAASIPDVLPLLDLAAHALALLTLVRAFRGRVNRQTTGRVNAPVLAVKFAGEVDAALRRERGRGGVGTLVRDVLTVAKALVFLIITTKLAFGRDRSYVGPNEWFPEDKDKERHDGGEEGPPRVVVVKDMDQGGCWGKDSGLRRHREKKAKQF